MKGVIIAAGYGSRFFPITKTIPKEMLPLYNIPTIQFSIDELVNAGIKDIIIVTSRRKKSLDDYFDIEFELETFFKGKEQEKLISPSNINVCFVRQKRMQGVGNAIMEAAPFIGNESFVLVYPDDVVMPSFALTSKLVELHNKTGKNVLSLLNKEGEDVSRFGVVDIKKSDDFFVIKGIIEKPPAGKEPSKYISIGRYLFTPEFLELLKEEWNKFDGKGEFYHIGVINRLCSEGKVLGIEVDKNYFFDTGTPKEYSKSFIRYALEYSSDRKEINEWLRNYLKSYQLL
jgi:UTP--glucose-1-phosphate uridylyltransferase